MMKRLLSVLLIFLSLLNLASAQVCRGELIADSVRVTNQGSDAAVFTLYSDEDWVTYAPERVILTGGESTDVPVYINPPRSVRTPYQLKTYIVGGGEERVISRQIDLADCLNLEVKIADNAFTSCPCAPMHYDFTIKNIGHYQETYDLSVDLPKGEYAIAPGSLTLSPGESRSAVVYINRPCEVFGEYSYFMTAAARKSGYEVTTPFYHMIRSCYGFSMQAANLSFVMINGTYQQYGKENGSLVACIGKLTTVPFTIDNYASFQNDFQLSLRGDANLSSREMTVPANGSARGELFMNTRQEGLHKLNLTATSARGAMKETLLLDVMSVRCFEEMQEPEEQDFQWLIIALLVLLLILIPLIILLVLRWREEKQPESFRDRMSELRKEREHPRHLLSEQETSYPIGRWLLWILIIALLVWLISGIRHPFLQKENTTMPIMTANMSDAELTPIQDFRPANLTGMAEDESPGMRVLWWLVPVLILILLAALFYSRMRKDEDAIEIVDLRKRKRVDKKERRLSPSIILVFMLIILMIALIYVFQSFRAMPAPAEEVPAINYSYIKTVFEWNKNTQKVINLSDYTVNEDEDLITYQVTPAENITIEIDGSIVTFTPEPGFTGERVINIIATDAFGARAYSPDILLRVKDRESPLAFIARISREFFSKAASFALISMLLMVVIVILLVLRMRDRRRRPVFLRK